MPVVYRISLMEEVPPVPRKKSLPALRLHKPSGLAVATFNGKDIYFGKHGTEQAQEAYDRHLAEWLSRGKQPPPSAALTVSQVLHAFWIHAQQHYRHKDGSPTTEQRDIKYSLKPLRQLYGSSPVTEFGPLAFKAVRQQMISLGWCRSLVNQRMGRIRRVFRWAVAEQLIPLAILQALETVPDLPKYRSQAPEPPAVLPVTVEEVNAARPFFSKVIAAMVDLQLLTGMRPGEVVLLRGVDLQIKGEEWLFTPATHKNAWRDQKRIIPLGPKARDLLKPWLRTNLTEYLFRPGDACGGRSTCFGKPLAERYHVCAYGRAIHRACTKAGIPPWHPHQLRHAFGTAASLALGKEHTQAALGHESPQATALYDHTDLQKAQAVMNALG
jgi:integrase